MCTEMYVYDYCLLLLLLLFNINAQSLQYSLKGAFWFIYLFSTLLYWPPAGQYSMHRLTKRDLAWNIARSKFVYSVQKKALSLQFNDKFITTSRESNKLKTMLSTWHNMYNFGIKAFKNFTKFTSCQKLYSQN